MIYLERIKDRLDELHLTTKLKFRGCSIQQVNSLEEKVKFHLPVAYREFLLWMGYSPGTLLTGSTCGYQDLPSLQEGAIELLQENNMPLFFPEYSFVFLMHQGYQFCFFNAREGDDPPIYWYIEGQEHFKKTFDHFSEFLMDVVNGYARLIEQTNEVIKANARKNPKFPRRKTELAKMLDMHDDNLL